MKEDVAKVRYPKKVRDLAKLEGQAVEILSYGSHNLHGLLQTEEYARALLSTRRLALSEDELERAVAARVARASVFARRPAPELSFVQEEVTLRRPVGGREVLRTQLEHLLELARLRHVEIQVMPTSRGDHPGTGGRIQVLKFQDGTAVGRADDEFGSRPVTDPRHLRILELRYGIIRAEALSARESLAFIEQVLGIHEPHGLRRSRRRSDVVQEQLQRQQQPQRLRGGRDNPGTVHVRDSKAPDGPRLTLTSAAWSRFVSHSAR